MGGGQQAVAAQQRQGMAIGQRVVIHAAAWITTRWPIAMP